MFTYGRKSDAIVGYDFNGDTYCPTHMIEELINRGMASPAARDMLEEDVLDQIAGANGIDRQDEHSFDSNDFPKVILSVQVDEPEECAYGHQID